jgi:hypothetical protein
LDKLEEKHESISTRENFRHILKKFIQNLQHNQKTSWKQRYTVRWTKLGDESTKFFHAATTERYRNNTITSIISEDGRSITDLGEKAALLWEEHRSHLGQTVQTQMLFDLSNLIQQHCLQSIAAPFTKEDRDLVVAKMPSDKAPGPEGFNGLFLKKCWHIIKEDIYQLCFDFFEKIIDMQSINTSFITLVPKVNNPAGMNDFKPISLINCVIKIITKLLGNRLQSVVIPLVNRNLYGFIKSRTIQDCLAWAFEYIHQCH